VSDLRQTVRPDHHSSTAKPAETRDAADFLRVARDVKNGDNPMSAPLTQSSSNVVATPAQATDRGPGKTERVDRPEPKPATGRWWFAFDRWLVVAEPDDDDFVLA
jgi:hypothetical protein